MEKKLQKVIRLDPEKDSDILMQLKSQDNYSAYLKKLVRKDITGNNTISKTGADELRIEVLEDRKLAEDAMVIYSHLGMDLNTVIKLLFIATVRDNGIPFPLSLNSNEIKRRK